MGEDIKTTHEAEDHDLANSADEVEIGTTAHTDRVQPVGHDLRPTDTNMNGSDEDDPKNHAS